MLLSGKETSIWGVLGFTEHSYRHVNLVSSIARNILERLGYPERQVELAAIAGYMHDIGNVVSRNEHGISGAVIAYPIPDADGGCTRRKLPPLSRLSPTTKSSMVTPLTAWQQP